MTRPNCKTCSHDTGNAAVGPQIESRKKTMKTIISQHMGITAKLGKQQPDHSGKTCVGQLGRDVCAERATCQRYVEHSRGLEAVTARPLTLPRVAGRACTLRVEVA